MNLTFKNTLIHTQIQNFLLYLVNDRADILVDNRIDRNYSQIYNYDNDGNLRETGESILYLIYNVLDETKRLIKPLDELKGSIVFESYDKTFSTYYNGIANMNMSDYFESDYLPHLKLLVQQFNDRRDDAYFQDIVLRSYKDPSAEAYRESRKTNGPLKFFIDEVQSFNQQIDDQFRLRVGVKETPELINLINFLKDIYEDNLYCSRFLYDFFFKRIFKETAESRGAEDRKISYRASLMDLIKDFNIKGTPAVRVIEQITVEYDKVGAQGILPHEDITFIADCFIDAFYKHLICIPFGVQIPVELVRVIEDYKYLYDTFKSQWENNYNGMSVATKTMARYFALNFLFIFYTYGVSVINGDMLKEDEYDQRKITLSDMSLSDYMGAVLKNMNSAISSFDFDREQSFFSSLDGFRTTLGGLYMEIFRKKRPSSPVIITEDEQQPYDTLEEIREREREEQLARDNKRLEDIRQAEYEKERETQEINRINQRELKRSEARARASAMFEENIRQQEIAIENERVRIERLEEERREIMQQNLEDQMRSLEEQNRQWSIASENLSAIERDRDLLTEEAAEQNLEWDYGVHNTDDEDEVDGGDIEPTPSQAIAIKAEVSRDIDPFHGVSEFLHPPFKRSAAKALPNLHIRKMRRFDDEELSDISDEEPEVGYDLSDIDSDDYKLSDIDSDLELPESVRALKNRKPIRNIPRKVKSIPKPKIGSKRKLLPSSIKALRSIGDGRRRDVVRIKAVRKFKFQPVQVLPSKTSFINPNVADERRFISDDSSEESESESEDEVKNPRLKRLKAQMKSYTQSILTDDEEIESIDEETDEERW